MASSCLNRTLISDAVAGTGANVSLLIQALAPLCPPPTHLVQVAADHRATVVVGYICGFLPWTAITLFDFISAKWKSVRTTRRLGYLHLVACAAPMVVVMGYAVLQALAGDYKEMMTAVIAVLLTLYHLTRTVWGLFQLREYYIWCKDSLQCISSTRPKHYFQLWDPKWADDEDVNEDLDEDEDEYIFLRGCNKPRRALDDLLMVNEEIVDNEFTGRDVSVSYSLKYGRLQVSNANVITLRWAAAFLCARGHYWKSEHSKPPPLELRKWLSSTIFYVDETQPEFKILSFVVCSEEIYSYGSECGSYGSIVDNEHLMVSDNAFRTLQFEFDNLVSSFPSFATKRSDKHPYRKRRKTRLDRALEQNRVDARLELVELLLVAKMLGSEMLHLISSQCKERRGVFICRHQFEDAFTLMLSQLRIEEAPHISNVHWFWKLAMVPHLFAKSNAFSFQTSVVVDCATSLEVGLLKPEQIVMENFQHDHTDLFKKYSNILQSYDYSNSYYNLGVALDIARTLLAESTVISNNPADPARWNPEIRKDQFSFVVSDYFLDTLFYTDKFTLNIRAHVLQECQIATQQIISENAENKADLPMSAAMIAFFLLSYPALSIERQEEDGADDAVHSSPSMNHSNSRSSWEDESRRTFHIEFKWAPQNVSLSLFVDGDTESASLKIETAEDNIKFDWEAWINSAMAILKAYNANVRKYNNKEKDEFCEPFNLIRKVDLTRPMMTVNRDEEDEILSQLPGQLHVWTGWPIFDVRFCHFELSQWMNACDDLPDSNDGVDEEYKQRKDNAMKALKAITEWNRV